MKSSNTNAPTEAAQPPSAPSALARSYAIAQENSSIEFVGSKVTGHHNGGFKKFAGEFKVANGKLANTGNNVLLPAGLAGLALLGAGGTLYVVRLRRREAAAEAADFIMSAIILLRPWRQCSAGSAITDRFRCFS